MHCSSKTMNATSHVHGWVPRPPQVASVSSEYMRLGNANVAADFLEKLRPHTMKSLIV